MSERIYHLREKGDLEPLEESPFALEEDFQKLIAEHPDLLGGDQMRPDDPVRWTLITREKGIPNKPNAGDWWAVDLLILDQDARLTLVEVKRGNNPEIRRSVVGQMMEYAAHAQYTWTIDELRETFEAQHGDDADDELARLLNTNPDTEPDIDAFWENVAANLAASRLRLLFVSDDIPDELERIVTFLNAQMQNVQVLAVEIKRFKGESSQTLVPRVLGKALTAPKTSSSSRPPNLTRDTFLDTYSVPKHREIVKRLMKVAQDAQGAARIEFGPTRMSIRAACEPWRYPYVTVAWLYLPETPGFGGLKNITFGEWISLSKLPPDGELKEVIDRWAKTCGETLAFGETPPSSTARGKIVGYDDAVAHIDKLERMLREIIPELAGLPAAN